MTLNSEQVSLLQEALQEAGQQDLPGQVKDKINRALELFNRDKRIITVFCADKVKYLEV